MTVVRVLSTVVLVVALFVLALMVAPVGRVGPVVCPVGTMVVPASWGVTAPAPPDGC